MAEHSLFGSTPTDQSASESTEKSSNRADKVSYTDWACGPNHTYYATSPSVKTIPPGTYNVNVSDGRVFFQKMDTNTDSLLELSDSPTRKVIDGIRKFWKMKEKYTEYGIMYRRGLLLSGPPGAGKTCSISILSKELVDAGGIVVYVGHPAIAALGLKHLRQIEPHRSLIVIFEDIDEMLEQYGEHVLLSLLDGENQITNVTNIASTNYPERLGARIVNRPSRFDEHILIDMPNEVSRRQYLEHLAKKFPLDETTLNKWVQDTNKLGIAHLKELFVAVRCLENPYEEVIKRLKDMASKAPAPFKEYGSQESRGFTGFFEKAPKSEW